MATTSSPIALFAYNRPDHVLRTISALQANPLARKSLLYVFSDGPKDSQNMGKVEAVRRTLKHITGFEKVCVREQPSNLGLATSIIRGVTELVEAYGRVIVLEDDLIVAPGFLTFMNQALERYEYKPRVMQVSGYMFPVEQPTRLGETFFSRVPTSWGWGTWGRAWKRFNVDSATILEDLQLPDRRKAFNLNGAYPYFEHLTQQAKGKLDVWGVRWYASMFAAGGLCLYPGQSLVRNIGMDGSGVHGHRVSHFDVDLSDVNAWTFPDVIEESTPAFEAMREFLLELQVQKQTGVIMDLVSRLRHVAGRMKRAITSAG